MKYLRSIFASLAFIFAIGAALATPTLESAWRLNLNEDCVVTGCVIDSPQDCTIDEDDTYFDDFTCTNVVAAKIP